MARDDFGRTDYGSWNRDPRYERRPAWGWDRDPEWYRLENMPGGDPVAEGVSGVTDVRNEVKIQCGARERHTGETRAPGRAMPASPAEEEGVSPPARSQVRRRDAAQHLIIEPLPWPPAHEPSQELVIA